MRKVYRIICLLIALRVIVRLLAFMEGFASFFFGRRALFILGWIGLGALTLRMLRRSGNVIGTPGRTALFCYTLGPVLLIYYGVKTLVRMIRMRMMRY